MNKKLSTILLILCFGNIFGFAQQISKEKTAEKVAPTGLVLEVNFYKGKPPGFVTIGDTLQTMRWAWYAWFERVPNFPTSAEKPPVQAVKFIPSVENGTVTVKVRVFLGQKTFEKEEPIALYSMREGERVTVKELSNYGVVPFEIAVVRVTPTVSAALPAIENKTTSLQVTAMEPTFSTLPSYKISILNNSNKAVSAFTSEMTETGRRRMSGMPQKKYNENLIEPGATWTSDIRIPLENKKSENGEVPKPTDGLTFVITSVVFADGSYEGDASGAALFRAFTLGRKIQAKRIVALLEEFENVSAFNLNKFLEQSAKLETTAGDAEFGALLKQFPALNEREKTELRAAVEDVAEQDVKMEFAQGTEKSLRQLETDAARLIYLKKLKGKYQDWLTRLP